MSSLTNISNNPICPSPHKLSKTKHYGSFRTFAVQRSSFSSRQTPFLSSSYKSQSKHRRGNFTPRTAETDAQATEDEEELELDLEASPTPTATPIDTAVPEEVVETPDPTPTPTTTSTPQTFRRQPSRDAFIDFGSVVVGGIYVGTVQRLASFGAFVDIGCGTDGLVHVSELAYEFVNDVADFVQVGQDVRVKVLDKDDTAMKLSLSMKIEEPGTAKGASTKIPFSELTQGEIYPGVVVQTAKFGAFVDIGAEVDGLVHVSQLSNRFVEDVKEVVDVGDEVKVKIIGIVEDKKQLQLSIRQAEGDSDIEEDDFEDYEDEEEEGQRRRMTRQRREQEGGRGGRREQVPPPDVDVGQEITGTIKRVVPYGVFVDIGNNFQAMLHKNEMKVQSTDPLWQVRDFFSLDQEVKVTVHKLEGSKIDLTQKSKEDREVEVSSKDGYTAVNEEDSYKPSLFAAAFSKVQVSRTMFPNHPDRAIVDPPEDLFPDVIEEAIEEVVSEVVGTEEETKVEETLPETVGTEEETKVEETIPETVGAVEEVKAEVGVSP
eukprot:TRINITY_DN7772_c0_g1_i12.p1 TRINITY_DN7772_c0_g1~~TRINITY_DN7772_c0_g1_i12.p1  ORF type:complete len:557 (+),score=142.27 TRINITY_DN7772_c0_g1_i12:39-1673(+)